MPRSMHLHTEIYPNLKTISEFTGAKPVLGPNCKKPYIIYIWCHTVRTQNGLSYCVWIIQNVHEKSFIYASRDDWVSCNQTLGCLRLYEDIRVSRVQPRINANEILLQHNFMFLLDIKGSQKRIATYNFYII